jgi:adenine-specific DNA-methyltransferase
MSAAALSVLATVPEWWRRRVAAAGIGFMSLANPPVPIEGVGRREDLLDASPEDLANAYVIALDERVRSAEGRHYTPGYLAVHLYRQAVAVLGDERRGLVWDPACGAGSLLLPALRHWVERNSDTTPELTMAAVQSAVGGCDTDGAAVWLGNVLLSAELLTIASRVPPARRKPIPPLLRVGDGLSTVPDVAPDVVILNPPYGRVRLTDDDRQRWQHVLHGHANRYGLFLAAAADMVAPRGVVSALVPAGWLGGSYFQRLRAHLAATAPLASISYVTDRSGVFATGVLQETVLATFHSGALPEETNCDRIFLNGVAAGERIGEVRAPRGGGLPWLLPRSPADRPVIDAASRMSRRLADHGWNASTGPLVWNRCKPLLSGRQGRNTVKVIWAADIDDGRVHQDSSRDSMRYLDLNGAPGGALILDQAAVLIQRTTAIEQRRRIVAGVLDAGTLARWGGRVVVENHVNVLTCVEPDSTLTAEILAALLESEALDRVYRCLSGSVAVSAYELAALPLPPPEVLSAWRDLSHQELSAAIGQQYGLPMEAHGVGR